MYQRVKLFLLACLTGGLLQAQTDHYFPGVLEVAIYTSHDAQEVSSSAQSSSGTPFDVLVQKYSITYFDVMYPESPNLQELYLLKFSDLEHVQDLIDELYTVRGIKNVEQIPVPTLTGAIPPDPGGANMWYFSKINQSGWEYWKDLEGKGKSIKIAIVDCGVRLSHEDIRDIVYINKNEIPGDGIDNDDNGYIDDVKGYDVADKDNDANPPLNRVTSSFFSHGTKVAGLSSASTNNGVGIASLGLNTQIIPVKCIPNDSLDNVLWYAWDGMRFAMNSGADIINCSWSQRSLTYGQQLLLDEIMSKGIIIVASAGNEGSTEDAYPAAYNGVIAVGATTSDDKVWSNSNFGSYIDVMAPGVNIFTTTAQSDNSYGYDSGTSFAAPIVSGFVGLLLSQENDPEMAVKLLKQGCDDIDIENPDKIGQMGAGRINIDKSLELMASGIKLGLSPVQNKEVSVYPNPNTGIIHFRTEAGVQQFSIIDLSGRVLVQQNVQNNHADISGFQLKGLYIIQMQTEDGSATSRIYFQ
ncbi:MAG: S8 family serine peptidase [Bacteroidetes bacterium]|nr:S8 family serine peptidase [Bacteroidota bacterium]